MSKSRAYGKYTPKKRSEVGKDAMRLGVGAAIEKHGIPKSTVCRWKKLAEADEAAKQKDVEKEPEAGHAVEEPELDEQGLPTIYRRGAGDESGRKVARRYTPSEKAAVLEYACLHGVSEAARKFGASRYSIYDWKRKVERAAEGQGPSPTSGPSAEELEEQRDREILGEWHKHPGLGPSQIRNQLRRRSVKVGVQTVRRVMEDSGYRLPRVRSQRHDERFEAVRPNHMWHLDYLHRHINRAQTHTLILLDDCSRYVVGHGTDDAERADLVIKTFEEAVERHGKPEMVLHDKGSAFWSWRGISRFTTLLTEMGVDQIAAEHKEWNGKLEVFNANLSKELFDVHRFYDVAEMRRRLASHLHWYNHDRTSHALGGLLAPADRYYGRAEEVLARIEAGTGRDGLDSVDLRHRCLELFKVVSQGGVPEVWLMGQKVLELRE
ncbi:MAG: DDE-type integrase/transposase/recombinase [bacterium]|nr:DDE-type integrase/transposase/recombinase [bacterium]